MILLSLLTACIEKPDPGDTAPVDDTGDTDTTPPDDTGSPDPDTVPLEGICEDATHFGNFLVDSNEDYAYVTGSVSDGVVPISILTDVLESGECRIWRRENPYCDPGCDPGYTCDFDGTCIPYPTAQDIGTVDVTGLVQAVSMTPVTPGYTYYDTSVPNPPWEPGALLTLESTGGAFAPFTLYGVAPIALVPDTMDWVVTQGEPFVVNWEPPTESVRTEVVLTMSIDQHGLTPSRVVCTFADDGEGEVPVDVLDELMALGVSGFPQGDLVRRSADRAEVGTDGCVDLVASSSRLAAITITGYTPCTADDQCPDGTTCNEAMERCE